MPTGKLATSDLHVPGRLLRYFPFPPGSLWKFRILTFLLCSSPQPDQTRQMHNNNREFPSASLVPVRLFSSYFEKILFPRLLTVFRRCYRPPVCSFQSSLLFLRLETKEKKSVSLKRDEFPQMKNEFCVPAWNFVEGSPTSRLPCCSCTGSRLDFLGEY